MSWMQDKVFIEEILSLSQRVERTCKQCPTKVTPIYFYVLLEIVSVIKKVTLQSWIKHV